jgi:hypothetical protein
MLLIVGALVAECLPKFIDLRRVSHEDVPVIMGDLVTKMP